MTVTAKVYGLGMEALLQKKVDFVADSIKAMLVTNLYTPNQDTDQFITACNGHEVSGTGYTAGGQALTTKTISYDAPSNTVKYTADNPSWPSSTITARYAVFYQDTGTPGTSPVLCYWDFGADYSSSAGTFTLTIDAAGILTLNTA